jgi:hypothetical protein
MGAESRLVEGIRVHSELLRDRLGTGAFESRPDDASEPVGKEGNAVKESLDLRRAELTCGGVEIGFDNLTDLFAEAGEGILPPGARSPVIAELIAGDAKEPRNEGRRIAGSEFLVGDQKDLLREVVGVVLMRQTCSEVAAYEQPILTHEEPEFIRLSPFDGSENCIELKCRSILHIQGSSPKISFLRESLKSAWRDRGQSCVETASFPRHRIQPSLVPHPTGLNGTAASPQRHPVPLPEGLKICEGAVEIISLHRSVEIA